ncbi:hypothetical protein [Vibrio alginolyticus]|uniref:hypothetical protein n=1 Tax=Vibrio alginolyticus TaxID=663 RepID=UPI000720780F|nr:hypothetical protein [Vibrio alginolyticus]ALR95693.1 hypothetical protein AT730_25985 [Vibrio alginolyticus]
MMKLRLILPLLVMSSAQAGVVFTEYESDTAYGLNDIQSKVGYQNKLPAHEILNALAPAGWRVNIGPGISSHQLAWVPSPNWRSAVAKIQELNSGIYIVLNEQERVLAASKNREHLTYLQTRTPKLWTLDPKLSLKENFEVWNTKSNIDIIWGSEYDFPVKSRSVLIGDLTGRDGVLDRVLKETLKTKEPLWISYSPEIGAAHILKGGSTEKGTYQ